MTPNHNNNFTTSLSSVTNLDDYIFDPLDGTFVRINISNTECSGTLSEQGRRDSWALVVILGLLSLLLLALLYTSCN